MEFGTREILILLGIVILLGILLDGIRRVRQARNGSLRVSRRKPAVFDDESYDDLPGELPTGEVRVTRRDEESVEQVSDNIRKYRERNSDKCTSVFLNASRNTDTVVHHQSGASVSVDHSAEPDTLTSASEPSPLIPEEGNSGYTSDDSSFASRHQVSGQDLGQEFDTAAEQGVPEQEINVALDEFNIEDDANSYSKSISQKANNEGRKEPTWGSDEPEEPQEESTKPEPFVVEPDPERIRTKVERKPFWESGDADPAPAPEPAKHSEPKVAGINVTESKVSAPEEAPQAAANSERDHLQSGTGELQVVVMHIMAKKEQLFEGSQLLEALLANGLRFGEMGIFHRHQYEDGSGPVHFSVANSVKPGTFNLDAMDDFETPGVTLFMNLEGLSNALDSYAVMIKAAQSIAKSLQGELKDENRSALTKQTIEHYRQQIIEYTRRSFTLSS